MAVREPAHGRHGSSGPRTGTSRVFAGSGYEVIYRGPDLARLRSAMSARLGPLELRSTQRMSANADFRALHQGVLSIFRLRGGIDLEMRLGPEMPAYLVFADGRGCGHILSDNLRIPLFPAVTSPGRHVVVTLGADADVTVICLRRWTLEQMARRRFPVPPKTPMCLAERLDPLDPRVRQWLGAVARLCGDASRLTRRPAVVAHLEHLLVKGLLDVQPAVDQDRPTVEAAMAFCEPRLAAEPTVGEIAEAVGVSVRTLQTRFRDGLGATPTGHLRALRLAHAHEALLDASKRNANARIRDIAEIFGFRHLGRFSALYRSSYGRLPSQTLRFGSKEVVA